MVTMLKSIFGFFRKSLLLLFCLFVLIFSSSLIATGLNITATNLQTTHSRLTNDGNLHDFVINEMYSTKGSASYEESSPVQEGDSVKVTFTPNLSDWTFSYLDFYQINKNNQDFQEWFNPIIFTTKWDLAKYPPNQEPVDTTTPNYDRDVVPSLTNFAATFKVELEETILSWMKESFRASLRQMPIRFRDYKAIDVPNSKQNIFYKVIETNPNNTINNLVIDDGNNVNESINFKSAVFDNFFKDTNFYSRKLLSLLSNAKWSSDKVKKNFIETQTFFSQNQELNPWTYSRGNLRIKKSLKFLRDVVNKTNGASYDIKDFRLGFTVYESFIGIETPIAGYIEDYSSYQAVVSPMYIEKFNKEIFSQSKWDQIKNMNQDDFNNALRSIDEKNKVTVDNHEFVITGVGLTPDFMYPVLSVDSSVPNFEKEALVYTNSGGYGRVYDAFKGNFQEENIIGTFLSDLNAEQTLRKINGVALNLMGWPEGLKAAYMADDLDNKLSFSAVRLQFIPQTLLLIKIIEITLTVLTFLLAMITSCLILKKFIKSNSHILAILIANGYYKRTIIISLTIFISLFVLFSVTLGFIVGFFLQSPLLFLISPLWTIPTSTSAFSFIGFFVTLALFLAPFMMATVLFSSYLLKDNMSDLMKIDYSYKISPVVKFFKKMANGLPTIHVFRWTVFLSSSLKIFLLIFISVLNISIFSFVLDSNNKLITASNNTLETKNFNRSIELITPTVEAGQYYAVPYTNSGMTLKEGNYFNRGFLSESDISENKLLLNQNYMTNSDYKEAWAKFTTDVNNKDLLKAIDYMGNYHLLSSTTESTDFFQNLFYMQNKTQNQILLDHFVGELGLGIGANPWDVAVKQMSLNQVNYAQASFRKILEKALVDTTNKYNGKSFSEHLSKLIVQTSETPLTNNSVFIDYRDQNNIKNVRLSNERKTIFIGNGDSRETRLSTKFVFQPDFVRFFMAIMTNEDYYADTFSIGYNKVFVDETDMPYTYVNFNFVDSNKPNVERKIKGINKEDTSMLLYDENKELLNNLLFEPVTNNQVPIIINHYAAQANNLKVNDVFQITANNKTDRYLSGSNNNVDYQFRVVGIFNSFQNNEFFVSQENANNILGLVNVFDPITNEFVYQQSGFNGIYSNAEKLIHVENGVSLYSPSGLYFGTDSFGTNKEALDLLTYGNNFNLVKQITKIDATEPVELIAKLRKTYGDNVYFSLVTGVENRNSLSQVAESLSSVLNNTQLIVGFVVVFFTMLIVFVIAHLITLDSLRISMYLKCLGYKDKNNVFSFLFIFIPVYILSVLISIPLTLWFSSVYNGLVFNFGSILVAFAPNALAFIIPFIWLLAIFVAAYMIAYYKIKKLNLAKTIKVA